MQISQHRVRQTGTFLLIGFLMCLLTLSLATRFCIPKLSQPSSAGVVVSRLATPKCQHLDRDATHWVTPVADFSMFDRVKVEPYIILPQTRLPNLIVVESLSNRAPPLFLLA